MIILNMLRWLINSVLYFIGGYMIVAFVVALIVLTCYEGRK